LNVVRLRAEIVELTAPRFTPAGVPVLELRLRHQDAVIEAGEARQLDFEVDAIAIGAIVGRLAEQRLGTKIDVDGFIAPRTRRSRRLVLHINGFEKSGD
jgi:primosomal replication protein N